MADLPIGPPFTPGIPFFIDALRDLFHGGKGTHETLAGDVLRKIKEQQQPAPSTPAAPAPAPAPAPETPAGPYSSVPEEFPEASNTARLPGTPDASNLPQGEWIHQFGLNWFSPFLVQKRKKESLRGKRKKKTFKEKLKDTLAFEAQWYIQNPSAILQALPPAGGRFGRGAGRRMTGRQPPSYQRGSVGVAKVPVYAPAARPRRARLTPRAGGRIGQQRPRSRAEPIGEPARVRPPTSPPLRRPTSVPASPPGVLSPTGPNQLPTAVPNVPNSPIPESPGTAPTRRSEPGRRTGDPGTRRVPGPAGKPANKGVAAQRPSLLDDLLTATAKNLLRRATQRSPRVSRGILETIGPLPQPIGDFPPPSPAPIAPTAPGLPSLNPFVGVIQSPAPFAVPQEALDKCRCDKRKPKKERKPREPRTKCMAGTYRQTIKGVSYSPKEEIPCEAAGSLKKSLRKKVSSKLPNIFGVPNALYPH